MHIFFVNERKGNDMDIKTGLFVAVICGGFLIAFYRNSINAEDGKKCAAEHTEELVKKRAELNRAKNKDILVIDDDRFCYVITVVPDLLVKCALNHREGTIDVLMPNSCSILMFKKVVTPDQSEYKQIEARPER